MAYVGEVKFGDLQIDERYKRLERALKVASLRKKSSEENKLSSVSPSATIPNMNVDSGVNISFLQYSRVNSDVSSNNDLRTMLLKKKDISSDHGMSSISDVRKYNKQSNCQKDRFIMQPPKFDRVPYAFKKSNKRSVQNEKTSPVLQYKCIFSDTESVMKNYNYKSSDVNSQYSDHDSFLQIDKDTSKHKSARIFIKWKLMLSEQGQLLVKGILECGIIARSKPIVKRLTSTTIESVFKHLYHLQGNIVDDEDELPEYVKGKFYNGFPDDWENVLQLWRTFVQQGCRITFRWPTPIADSDDDLRSEVTDMSFAYLKSSKDKKSNSKLLKKLQASQAPFHSNCYFNVSQRKSDKILSPHNYKKRDSFTQTCISDISENSCSSVGIQTVMNQVRCDKKTNKKQEDVDINRHIENKENNLKDKLNDVVNSLADKNCSKKCIDKIIEIFDCLSYVVSHGSVEDNKYNMETEKPGNRRKEQSQEINSESEDKYRSLMFDRNRLCSVGTEDAIVKNKIVDNNNLLRRKRTFTQMSKDNDSDSCDSESEIYVGVPKIPVERLSWSKEMSLTPSKRKIKKKAIHQKYDVMSRQYISSIPSVERRISTPNYKQMNDILNDSSVSVAEDQRDFLKAKKRDTNPNVQSKIIKPLDFDVVQKEQWKKLHNFRKDKDMHEMQGRFTSKNSTPLYGSIKNLYDSSDGANNVSVISVMEKDKDTMGETNSFLETINEKENKNMNHQYQNDLSYKQFKNVRSDTSEPTKPLIISSVPVDIEISNSKSKYFLRKSKTNVIYNEDNDIEELNEERRSKTSMQQSSLLKPNTVRKINSTSLTESKQNFEKHDVQLGNTYSSTSKQSTQDYLKVSKVNQNRESCKPKLLSAWVPKVVNKSGLHLIFQGVLINEAGHVVDKRFKTDIVLRRISPRLIETIDHEFYQLNGELNDKKHVVPDEIVTMCRYGCPPRIEQFCRIWESLKNADVNVTKTMENLEDTPTNTLNVGISSKGRRIIPPLSYWRGERISLKDNNPVYDPGTLEDSLTVSSYRSPQKSKQIENVEKQRRNNSNKSSVDKLEDRTTISPEKSVNKTSNDPRKMISNRSRKFITKQKRRAVEALETTDFSDDENISSYKKDRVKATKQTLSDSVIEPDRENARSINVKSSRKSTDFEARKVPMNSTKENEEPQLSVPRLVSYKETSMNRQFSPGKHREVEFTYYQNVPLKDDILSDDQQSHV